MQRDRTEYKNRATETIVLRLWDAGTQFLRSPAMSIFKVV